MRVQGTVTYKATFDVYLPMTQEHFDSLSPSRQNIAINNYIDPTLVDYYDTEIDDDIEVSE